MSAELVDVENYGVRIPAGSIRWAFGRWSEAFSLRLNVMSRRRVCLDYVLRETAGASAKVTRLVARTKVPQMRRT